MLALHSALGAQRYSEISSLGLVWQRHLVSVLNPTSQIFYYDSTMTQIEEWDWVHLGDSEGRIDRPSQVLAWPVPPDVRLDREWLTFHYPVRVLRQGRRALQVRRVRAGRGLLTEFIALADAPAERILEYARRYGPFGFCKHGDPRHRLRLEGCGALTVSRGTRDEAGQLCEAVQWWRNLACHARALLNAAAQLCRGKLKPVSLIQLNPALIFANRLKWRALLRNPEPFVVYGLDLWLRFFQVRPRASYNPRRGRFEIRISGSPALAGALALQIMLALTRSAGIAICSSCGKTFPPSRRPNPHRNSYCESCGIKAAWRDAQARRRQSSK